MRKVGYEKARSESAEVEENGYCNSRLIGEGFLKLPPYKRAAARVYNLSLPSASSIDQQHGRKTHRKTLDTVPNIPL